LHRITFLDPMMIQNLKAVSGSEPDPELVEAVDKALLRLDPDLRRLIRERYFEGLTVGEISERNNLPEPQAIAGIYEAKRRLKVLLADFVRKRWGIEVTGVCSICSHPRKEEIENALRARKSTESWGSTCRKIEQLIEERIQPPQVLKAHIRHMK
jgi:hypothetical protein